MYQKQRTNHYKNGRNNTFKRNFMSGKRAEKKLDSRMFINNANSVDITPEKISTASFSDFTLPEILKNNIASHNYITPTEIQEKTIPHLLQGRDVIGIANTGTGKTAAFLIPLIAKCFLSQREQVLIVTPTRELAVQILNEFNIFSKAMNLRAVLCIGGANMHRQELALKQYPQFFIGTPGRLKDLINRRKLNLSSFRSIVLDEVDRMVDIGFIKDIQYIISFLPQVRQSLFFSATVSGPVKDILLSFVKNPVTISVKQQETSGNVQQDIIQVKDKNKKLDILHDLLIQDGFNKVLIFGKTKWGVEKLSKSLLLRGFRAASIHGNKSQGQRQRALEQFKNNQVQVLLATDVASRGLDIENVTHVINYEAPSSFDDYIHRIGRTGRANKRGIALTFVE